MNLVISCWGVSLKMNFNSPPFEFIRIFVLGKQVLGYVFIREKVNQLENKRDCPKDVRIKKIFRN